MKLSIAVALWFAFAATAIGQSTSLPPIGKDAIQNPGKIIEAYDAFTDKSKKELLIPLAGEMLRGVHLYVLTTFNGKVLKEPGQVVLMILATSEKATHEGDKLFLLVDGERREIEPTYLARPLEGLDTQLELFIVPDFLPPDYIRKLSLANQVKGRIGSYLTFEVGKQAQDLLRDFVLKLDPNSPTANARQAEARQLKQLSPEAACSVFADVEGMQTRGYKQRHEAEYGCLSFPKEFGDGYPLKNNIAYYVSGSAREVKELKLVLNVNIAQQAADAHTILSKCGELLAVRAAGVALPDKIKDSILAGKPGEWRIGSIQALLHRSDWPTGRGYDLKFIIK